MLLTEITVAVEHLTPVSAIEGIGPTIASALERSGVCTVFDLLRAPPSRIATAIAPAAGFEQVRSWRAMASLLQVAEVTPQWAEALVRSDVSSVSDLRHARLSELESGFADARARSDIPDVPTSEQIAEMVKDAAVIDCSGAVTGTIRGREDRPVEGATVRVGPVQGSTDPRGRFRLIRIPWTVRSVLSVEHPEHRPLEAPVAVRAAEVVDVQTFRLQAGGAGEPVILSELAGDRLPPFDGRPIRQQSVDANELTQGDVLRLAVVYETDPPMGLVSRLLSFEAGIFRVRTVRVDRSSLPEGATVGDHFVFSEDSFRPVEMDNNRLRAHKLWLQAGKAFARQPPPATPTEMMAELDAKIRWVKTHGPRRWRLGGP
jgi:hypothetical protein